MPWALSLARLSAGRIIEAKIAMMAMTTSNSIKVKALGESGLDGSNFRLLARMLLNIFVLSLTRTFHQTRGRAAPEMPLMGHPRRRAVFEEDDVDKPQVGNLLPFPSIIDSGTSCPTRPSQGGQESSFSNVSDISIGASSN